MTPEELKKIKNEAMHNRFYPVNDIYEMPVMAQLDQASRMISQSFEDQVMKVVYNVGVTVDKDGLVKALNQDRERYEQAWCEGYAACKKEYEARLLQIAKLTGIYLESEDE